METKTRSAQRLRTHQPSPVKFGEIFITPAIASLDRKLVDELIWEAQYEASLNIATAVPDDHWSGYVALSGRGFVWHVYRQTPAGTRSVVDNDGDCLLIMQIILSEEAPLTLPPS